MAIQVWDEQTQQYRGVELARYGADGTLAEALVWAGGQYRRVWPTSNDFTDDFTSPELHERWTIMDGEYSPPGLSNATVFGPQVSDAFEISLTCDSSSGPVVVYVISDDFEQGTIFAVTIFGQVQLGTAFSEGTGMSGMFTLRRAGGSWTALLDGVEIAANGGGTLAMPDAATEPLKIMVETAGTMLSISYTEL